MHILLTKKGVDKNLTISIPNFIHYKYWTQKTTKFVTFQHLSGFGLALDACHEVKENESKTF